MGKNPKNNRSKPKISRTHKPDDLSLEEWQRILRKQYGEQQNYKLKNTGSHPVFSEFSLTNPESGKTYKIAIRGNAPLDNYCSCPDYGINSIGTCKHIEFTLSRLKKIKGAKNAFEKIYKPPYSEVYLSYGIKREVKFKAGKNAPAELLSSVNDFFDKNGILKEKHILDFHRFFNNIPKTTHEVCCYDDVMDFIALHQDAEHRRNIIKSRLKEGINSPIFKNILKTKLYPYQGEGALFAVNAGRCLIGDDMGLGKTIQALAASELMAELFNIRKVLIISPASLKHQWREEIEKFSGQTVQVIEGFNHQRKELYQKESFYKLINYELVFRDLDMIKNWAPDLIILDEAQRIKNWKTRTARYVKQLESTFAIVLTGTPIENKIEELHSIIEFIDKRRLGRVHRIGQYRTVRVINFVTANSIEERILDLLKFKKSLFAGVLNDNGEDTVMIGDSQLKRFMQSVETITENMDKPDPAEEKQLQMKERADKLAADIQKQGAGKQEDGIASLSNLFQNGAELFTKMSKNINSMISQDEKTGQHYLKIPLNKIDAIKNIFSALGNLIEE